MDSRDMQVIGVCRFSYPALGGFQVDHDTTAAREAYLYAPARMEERLRTFEALTLPALRAQSDPDFTFLVVIGESLPRAYRDRLEALLAGMPQAVVRAHPPGRHRDVMKRAVNSVREARGLPSLQFRMDDDDAVGRHFVERLRQAASDIRGTIRANRYCAIDFTQGFIARPGPEGIAAAPTRQALWTPALAMAVKPAASRCILNFSHAKLDRMMPVLSLPQEPMFVRGHNDYNDSRQKPGVRRFRLDPLDAQGEARFRNLFAIDAERVRALYA
jgi:hypothetical protein